MKISPRFFWIATASLLTTASGWSQGVQTLKNINIAPLAPSSLADDMAAVGSKLYISTDDDVVGSELWLLDVAATFNNPNAVALDSASNVYVADTSSHTIRKITAAGVVSTLAGGAGVSGTADFIGLAARFSSPRGVAVQKSGAAAGTVFVADTGNHVIRRITPDGVVTTWAGLAGTSGSGNGNGGVARFNSPEGVAVDGTGIVFVADTGNHLIRRIDVNGNVTTVGGIAGSSGDTNGNFTISKFNGPRGVAVDSGGHLLVADTGNHLIRRISNIGDVTTLAGGTGQAGSTDATGTAARFSSPRGVAVDSAGNVYAADTGNSTIRKITSAGVVTTLAGSAGQVGSTDATGAAARFSSARGLAVDTTGVYMADTGNHLIRKVIVASGVTTKFAGTAGVAGNDDGAGSPTVVGTTPSLVKDILPGTASSGPTQLTAVGSNLFFTAVDSSNDRDLWKSNGTNIGTIRVGTNPDYNLTDGPEQLTEVNGTLFFSGRTIDHERELWRCRLKTTDGTVEVLEEVLDINTTSGLGGNIRDLFSFGGNLFFVADDGGSRYGPGVVPPSDPAFEVGEEIWKCIPTPPGVTTPAFTELVSDVAPGGEGSTGLSPPGFTAYKNRLYFTAKGNNLSNDPVGNELFRTTGLKGAPELVKDIEPTGDSSPSNLVVSGPTATGRLYFVANTVNEGLELWTSDGSLEDTENKLVKDIFIGTSSSDIANITPMVINTTPGSAPTFSNRVVFTADEGSNGNELWHSDGTAIGTVLLKDITSGIEGSILSNFVSLSSNLVVFTQEDATTANLTLWVTNGTTTGTIQIEDFLTEPTPGTEALSAKLFRNPVLVGSTLYFMMGDDELWKTNGINDAGTVRVHRFRTGTQGSAAQTFTQLADGRAVFSATSVNEGTEPWITNGTGAGTVLLGDLFAGTEGSDPLNFTAGAGSQFFFTASATAANREIYVSNGTTTTLLKEINPSGTSLPGNLFWNKGAVEAVPPGLPALYFSADDDLTGSELWKSDGTTVGTVRVKDINTAVISGSVTADSEPGGFTAIGNTVYFAATDSFFGRELYKTDGSAVGTVLVKDISAVGINDSDPEELVVMPATGALALRKLYFIASGSGGLNGLQNTGRELWKSDGTDLGTVVVKDIVPGPISSIDDSSPAYLTLVGTTLYFVADDGVNGRELWKSNGTAAGTVLVKNINTKVLSSGRNAGSGPTELRNVNGKLFLLADDGDNGRELWVSNGTAAGTVMVKNLVAGSADAAIDNLTVVNDVVSFVADDGISGREVWISDGTAAGTRLAFDFVPGSSSSNPGSLFNFNSNLLFAAADSADGNEPRIAFMAPKIIVEQPAATPLVSGVSIVDFNTVAFGQNASLPFVIKNDGITSLTGISALLSGPNAADFTIATKPAAVVVGSGSSTMVVKFTPKEGGLRTATLTILNSDPITRSFLIQLTGTCTKDPTITLQPVSQMVNLGQPVTFTSAATGTANLSSQWRRNAGAIVGATSSPYVIFSAQIAHAGAISVQVKNGALPVGTGTSNNAELGVVEDFNPPRLQQVKVGTASTTIAVNAAGNGLSYLWKRSTGGSLIGVARFKNITTKTLTITAVELTDNVDYFCEVTGPGGMKVGGTTHLQVFNARPSVDDPQNMPDGIVSRWYTHQITVAAGDATAPVSYSATGLPGGVTLNTKTGLISGRPTKAGTYNKIKINATNTVGADLTPPADESITIVDMPPGLEGVYTGLVEREANLNENLGGRIDVTVTALTGAFTGSLTMGTVKYPFKGGLDIGIAPGAMPTDPPTAVPPYSATVTIPRTGILAPLLLTFTIDPTTKDVFTSGQVTSQDVSGPVMAAVTGWKQIRKATPVLSSAAAYLGLYNFGLGLPVTMPVVNPNIGDNNVPQGNGYGSFTVVAAGTLTIAGKTPDGETLTGGTFVGPTGQVLVFQPLYTTKQKGSILGQLSVGTGAFPTDPNDNVITGDLDLVRPPNPAVVSSTPSTRTYRAGFGLAGTPVVAPIDLEAFGGCYFPPTTLLKITSPPPATPPPAAANASVKFTSGGVDGNVPSGPAPTLEPDINVAVTATNTIVVIGSNAAKTKITPTVKTGAITGSFALSDPNLRTNPPLTPNPVLRSVNFYGVIVPEGGGATHRGVGLFMLPQTPTADNATLPTTTRILSGKMAFEKL